MWHFLSGNELKNERFRPSPAPEQFVVRHCRRLARRTSIDTLGVRASTDYRPLRHRQAVTTNRRRE